MCVAKTNRLEIWHDSHGALKIYGIYGFDLEISKRMSHLSFLLTSHENGNFVKENETFLMVKMEVGIM